MLEDKRIKRIRDRVGVKRKRLEENWIERKKFNRGEEIKMKKTQRQKQTGRR